VLAIVHFYITKIDEDYNKDVTIRRFKNSPYNIFPPFLSFPFLSFSTSCHIHSVEDVTLMQMYVIKDKKIRKRKEKTQSPDHDT